MLILIDSDVHFQPTEPNSTPYALAKVCVNAAAKRGQIGYIIPPSILPPHLGNVSRRIIVVFRTDLNTLYYFTPDELTPIIQHPNIAASYPSHPLLTSIPSEG